MKILDLTAHVIVKNEEQWVWYAIQSVLPYVSRVILYDTGSHDNTLDIINSVKSKIISISTFSDVNPGELTKLRNRQIKETRTKWFMVLDGDEVWPQKTMLELQKVLETADEVCQGIVVPATVPVGDLFHCQPEAAGKYLLMGRKGHVNLRIYRKRPGHSWKGNYPLEAYIDTNGFPIQNNPQNLIMLKNSYWHLTHLIRSSQDDHAKRKLEIGERINLPLPDVFFKTRPKIVPTPWVTFGSYENFIAQILTPLLNIKRKLS